MTDFLLIEHDDTEVIEVVTAGAQGPQGNPGPTGPAGSAGPTGATGPMGDVTPEALAAVEAAESAAAEADQSAADAQAAADYVAGASGARDTKSVASLLADNTFTYTTGVGGTVIAGDILRTRTEGFSYVVRDPTATDNHLITAGGVKIDCLPTETGYYNFMQMGPDNTGVNDCYDKLMALVINTPKFPATGYYKITKGIYFPAGTYYISQSVEIKSAQHWVGQVTSHGVMSPILRWPKNIIGVTLNWYNTLAGGTETTPTGGSDQTIIEGLAFNSVMDASVATRNTGAHAIWMRARSIIRHCSFTNWGGDGIHITGAVPSAGNTNGWIVDSCKMINTENGVYVDGPDSNAGCGSHIDSVYCRRWHIWDSSFLGNVWIGGETANCGRSPSSGAATQTAFCTYLGTTYQIHPSAAADAGRTTTPGTNSNVWYPSNSGLLAAEWTGLEAVGFYRSGGPYLVDNINAASVLIGCYTEQGVGLSWLLGPQISVGGFMGGIGTFIGGSGGQLRAPKLRTSFGSSTVAGMTTSVTLGEQDGYFLTMEVGGGATPTGPWRLKASGDGLILDNLNSASRIPFTVLGSTGLYPYKLSCGGGISLGSGSTQNLISKSWQPTFPTTGNYYKGDILFIQQANAGAKAGIICTTSGVAGSTAVFKLFGAIDA